MGRPRKTLKDLPKGWKERILKESKEGASLTELAVILGLARETFYSFIKREEDFSNTIEVCKQLSEAWWLKQGRINLTNREFNYQGYRMNMQNRFNWGERVESEEKKTINIVVDQETKNDLDAFMEEIEG